MHPSQTTVQMQEKGSQERAKQPRAKQQKSWKSSGQMDEPRRTDQPACAQCNWDIRGLGGVFRWDLKVQMGQPF